MTVSLMCLSVRGQGLSWWPLAAISSLRVRGWVWYAREAKLTSEIVLNPEKYYVSIFINARVIKNLISHRDVNFLYTRFVFVRK